MFQGTHPGDAQYTGPTFTPLTQEQLEAQHQLAQSLDVPHGTHGRHIGQTVNILPYCPTEQEVGPSHVVYRMSMRCSIASTPM